MSGYLFGCGSKLKSQRYAGFSCWFYVQRHHFGSMFLSTAIRRGNDARFGVSHQMRLEPFRGFISGTLKELTEPVDQTPSRSMTLGPS